MCHFSFDSVFHRRAALLPPPLFERIASEVLPFARTVYLSAGCESFTSPHFLEILEIASRHHPLEMKVLTNGLLLTPDLDDALIDHGMTEVHFSIDGATRRTYESIRRGGDFEVLLTNIARLSRRKAARASERPRLQFNVVLMRSNLDELVGLVDLAVGLGVEQIACRHLMPYEGLGMSDESTACDPECANERFHAMLEHAARTGVRITSFPDFFAIDGKPWRPRSASDAGAARPLVPTRSPPDGRPPVDPERPFGHVDTPAASPVVADGSITIAGWALDAVGVDRVEIRRDPLPPDRPEHVAEDGRVPVGVAEIHSGTRPDVAALYPDVPWSYRSGWSFELRRSAVPPGYEVRTRIHVVAHGVGGSSRKLGTREIVFGADRPGRSHLFCMKPFECVYIDAHADVYPYPDCQAVDPFGSLAGEASFRDIWFGERFRELRRRIAEHDPPGMCRTCPDFINRCVDDERFFRERDTERAYRRATGFVDTHEACFHPGEESVTLRGWALSFAGIEKIELLLEAVKGEPREAIGANAPEPLAVVTPGSEARPDVAAVHPHYPGRERAGWRFELRAAMLPPGPGPFRIRARARNGDGDAAVLGSTIVRFTERRAP